MASPPNSSAMSPGGLALPRQRPNLALPSSVSRKPSVASIPSAHPLRQTSFPPPDSLEAQHKAFERAQFSPADDASLDGFSDAEITSAINGNVGNETKKRKRGEGKSTKGRKSLVGSRAGSVNFAHGDDARSSTTAKRGGTTGAPSLVNGEADRDDDDDDDDEAGGTADKADGAALDFDEMERDKQRRMLFRETVPPSFQQRYDAFNKVRLQKADVRKLVNATLSQSVPAGVVTVVQSYTKMFTGILIESAREVQAEWLATEQKRADGEEHRAYKRLKLTQPTEPESQTEGEEDDNTEDDDSMEEDDNTEENNNKKEHSITEAEENKQDDMPNGDSQVTDKDTQPGITQSNSSSGGDANGESGDGGAPKGKKAKSSSKVEKSRSRKAKLSSRPAKSDETKSDMDNVQPGAWGLSKAIEECDRGPLLPDHLREALRRYKKSRAGGTVGYGGLSLEGKEVAAPRMGGKRLFK